MVADPGARFIQVKAIGVLHDEFTPSHETEAGADFISKLCLDLIEIQRHLPIGSDFASEQVGNHFLMGRPQAELALVTILEAHQFFAVKIPSAGFSP